MNGKREVAKSPERTDVGLAAREMIQLQNKKLGHSEAHRRHMEREVSSLLDKMLPSGV